MQRWDQIGFLILNKIFCHYTLCNLEVTRVQLVNDFQSKVGLCRISGIRKVTGYPGIRPDIQNFIIHWPKVPETSGNNFLNQDDLVEKHPTIPYKPQQLQWLTNQWNIFKCEKINSSCFHNEIIGGFF